MKEFGQAISCLDKNVLLFSGARADRNAPLGSDGALLCNFESTMFKKNLQGLAAFKTFNYASTEGVFQNRKLFAAIEQAGGQQ